MVRKSLSNIDTAWLRMEDPTNLMMITGFMTFGAPMDFARLKATLEHRLVGRFDRFRQRVVQPKLPLGSYVWEDDRQFDLNYHLQRITLLPPPGDPLAFQQTVSHLMSTPLDLSRPLWQMHLVESYGDGCALIVRLHHCIADGIALVQVLLSLTDTVPDAPWPTAEPPQMPRRGQSLMGTLFGPARSALKATTQVTKTLLHEGIETLVHPTRTLDLARLGANSATAMAKVALRWPDPRTLFKGKLGVPKQAAWSEPIELSDVKAVGRALGGTINDVLLTAVAGALRRYMQGRDAPVEGLNFRAVIPVNLRPPDAELTLGNKFGLVFLSLPIGIADPIERLQELKQRMDELKGSPEAILLFGILNFAGMSPVEIQDILVDIFGSKATGVMTNVPGPRETIYLADAPLDTLMFWVPQSGHLGLGVSILSYAGRVWLGIATDQGLVTDPENIIAGFQAEFDDLLELARRAAEQAAAETVAATPENSIQAMMAVLEEANQKIAALIDQSVQRSEAAPQKTPEHCQAKIKAGRQCKNRPMAGSSYCRVHQPDS